MPTIRIILSLVVLAALLAPAARGQVTTDQLNKLSLESLTAPPPRGASGYAPLRPRSTYHRPGYHASRRYDGRRYAHRGHVRRHGASRHAQRYGR